MNGLLIGLVLQASSGPGTIPHLAKGDLAVVSEGGGQMGYVGRLIVRENGRVLYSSSTLGKPAKLTSWRMTKGELGAFRMLIVGTDFPALHQEPRAKVSPSAFDAIDRGLAVRKGATVRGWSNTIWQEPEAAVPLFERLRELVVRSRSQIEKP